MALYKFKHGEGDNLSFDKTPFHEGWCYITHTGEFYVDLNIGTPESPNNQRLQINEAFIKQLLNIQNNIGHIDAGEITEEGADTNG